MVFHLVRAAAITIVPAALLLMMPAAAWAQSDYAVAEDGGVVTDDSGDSEEDNLGPEAGGDDRARTIYRRGDLLYNQGRYEEALVDFLESYRLSERPRILLAIANTYERLGRYRAAVSTLRQYAPSARAEEELNIRERIRSLERRLEAQEEREAETRDSETLPTPEESREALLYAPPPGSRRGGGGSSVMGWVLVGTGGAAVAAGTVFAIVAQDARSEAGDLCSGAGGATVCSMEAETLFERNRLFSRLTDGALVAGTAALLGGVILLALSGGEDATSERGVAVSPTQGGLNIGFVTRF